MVTVQRVDAVAVKELKLSPEGFLSAPATVARVGILEYVRDGRPFREFVPAETLFSQDSMDSLLGMPLTNRHPGRGKVDAADASLVMKGVTLPPAEKVTDGEDELLACKVKVMDAKTIGDIKRGVVELSCGYDAHLDMTPGSWKGQAYDAVQTKRIYNHLAVVPAARAGHKARLHLDSAHNVIEEEQMELVVIKIDGKDVQVPKESQAAIEGALAAGAEARAKADTLQAKVDAAEKAETERNSEKTKADEKARIDAMVKERVDLLGRAKAILPEAEHAKLDGLDALGIKKLVIGFLEPDTKLDGKSDEYVAAYFDAQATKASPAKRQDGVGSLIVHGVKGGKKEEGGKTVLSLDEAREVNRKEIGGLYREPLA